MEMEHQVRTNGKNHEEMAFVKHEGQPWTSERKKRERVASSAGLAYIKIEKQ